MKEGHTRDGSYSSFLSGEKIRGISMDPTKVTSSSLFTDLNFDRGSRIPCIVYDSFLIPG